MGSKAFTYRLFKRGSQFALFCLLISGVLGITACVEARAAGKEIERVEVISRSLSSKQHVLSERAGSGTLSNSLAACLVPTFELSFDFKFHQPVRFCELRSVTRNYPPLSRGPPV